MSVLSPRALAKAIGASESTLKRWIDAGRLRATRTSGGHRRVPTPDAIAFVRDANLQVPYPELLGLSAATSNALSHADEHTTIRTLFRALAAGDCAAVNTWIAARPDHETMVQDALLAIRELWAHDPQGTFVENRALECLRAAQDERKR